MASVLTFSSRWLMALTLGLMMAFTPGLVHAQYKKDGTPDMRFKVNKQKYGNDSSSRKSNNDYSSRKNNDFNSSVRVTKDYDSNTVRIPKNTNRQPRENNNSDQTWKRDNTWTSPTRKNNNNNNSSNNDSWSKPRKKYDDNTRITKDYDSNTVRIPKNTNRQPRENDNDGNNTWKRDNTWTSPTRKNNNNNSSNDNATPRLKKDGTPDMRYKENKQARDNGQTWNRDSNTWSKPHLKKDGTPDMRYKENQIARDRKQDYNRKNRPVTSTPRNQWKTDKNGRYYDPSSGRPLNNDGTFDMRRRENKDLSNPSARVRYGKNNNYDRSNQISQKVRYNNRHKVVINNYYTNIYNTYVTNTVVYGSWGYQRNYYNDIVWGRPVSNCYYGCSWYTSNYWDVYIRNYDYYPSYYYPFRPVVLSDYDLSIGLVSWLFVRNSTSRAYDQGYNDGYDDASADQYYDQDSLDYYREALPSARPVERGFQYSQAYMPTEDFVELAKDISGADPQVVQNFMDGLENLTTNLQLQIRVATGNFGFTIAKHDIDVRVAENHGNLLAVLKGHVDRKTQDGRGFIARADFTGTIDLTTGEVRIFVVASNNSDSPAATPQQIEILRDINAQIDAVDAQINP